MCRKVADACNISDFKLFLQVSDAVLFSLSARALTTNLVEQTIPIRDNFFIYKHLPAVSLISFLSGNRGITFGVDHYII